ncbi:outer membrane lipoprotein chaperone LolA [Escherichia coli]|nr:outer membrane lipoprotein chaperone LolA [Escherichia coli]
MSNLSLDFSDNTFQPLAARMRPENLAQYIGQQHLLAAGKPLPRAIEAGHLHSMILWGPPGTGKTTLAEVIARYANADVERISAVTYIKQNGDDFVLTPKASNGNLKQFTINVGRDGTIHQFSAVEQDDQRSSYQLKSQQNGAVDAAKFTFTPPQGVTVDDQRK